MSRVGWVVAVAATALLVWFNAAELPVPARLWTAALLAVLPPLMVVQAAQLREFDELPRTAAYTSSIISLWVLALVTAAVSRASGFGAADLGFVSLPLAVLSAWTAGLTAAGIAVLFGFRLLGFRESPLLRQLLPVTGQERWLFAGVSVTAGITEEIVFRGFLLYVLLLATASLPLALLLSACVFGVVHAYQQPAGALRAALLGALLALPLVLHGSIYPAILAHALIDLLSGLWLARYLLR
jgi:uncharacterized protein